MVQRIDDLNWLKSWQGHEAVKVITGVRRCGKSTLLLQYQEDLVGAGLPVSRILTLNFENFLHYELRKPEKLHQFVHDFFAGQDGNCHLLFDEIQLVDHWEEVINSLRLDKRFDLVITGSNANLLASELSTRLSGRYVQRMLLPFSLAQARLMTPDLSLNDYLRFGGFPSVIQLASESQKLNQLADLTDSILFKDILLRGSVSHPIVLQNLSRFLFDIVGNRSSVRKITQTLNRINADNTRQETISRYISLLLEAYLLYEVHRYDLRGKAILSREPKYYAVDMGIRTVLTTRDSRNLGSVLENLVYLELLRRGYRVFIGQTGEYEIDFVAETDEQRIYLQVSLTLLDEKTAEREFRPLAILQDNYPKYVLSLDTLDLSREGIKHLSAERFLMGEPIG